MKYKALFGSILAISATSALAADETPSFQKIISNNYNSASSYTSYNTIDLDSVWFNPANVAENGQQASINLINNTAGSLFVENKGQYYGVNVGRTPQGERANTNFDPNLSVDDADFNSNITFYSNPTDNQSYDIFWAKKDDNKSMGAQFYWSTGSNSELNRETLATYQILANSFETIIDEDNSINADIKKNTIKSLTYDTGINFGLKSNDSQITVNINTHDSIGAKTHFKGTYTVEALGVTTTYTEDDSEKTTDRQTSINSTYIQKMSDTISLIGNAGLSLGKYKVIDEDINTQVSGTTTITDNYKSTSSNTYNDISLAAGVNYTISPNNRVSFNFQQILYTNLDFNSAETEIEVNHIDTNGTITQRNTGVNEKVKSNGYSISAPLSLSMQMQATKKLSFNASLSSNAIYLESRKSTNYDMSEVENNVHIEGASDVLDNSSFLDTNTFTGITWGGSYQFNDNFVIDFISVNSFLTDGITDGGIVSQLTLTYKF